MAHKITHFEIMGPDGSALASFYREVFGWTPTPVDGFPNYFGIDGAEVGGAGGALGQGSEEMPQYTAMYVGVDSIDSHLEMITSHGGTTMVPRQVIPGVITFAMFRDPAGNLMGLTENEIPGA